MKETIRQFPHQCEQALQLGRGINIRPVAQVIVAGMGGSGVPGDILQTVAEGEIPVSVTKDYSLPLAVDERTLVFAISYSGNTEETLAATQEALKKQAAVVGVGSGGQLEALCRSAGLPFVKVPGGIPPRMAAGYLTIPLITVLQENGLISDQHIDRAITELRAGDQEKEGKRMAERLADQIPLVYSSRRLFCVAYGWKIRLNENSKVHAFANQFPELNHNEIVGYTKKLADFHTILIRDADDHQRVKKRFAITQRLIEKQGGTCTALDTAGSTLLSRIFSSLYLADWTSYYLAQHYGVAPEPVEIVEQLKKELSK